MATSTATPLVSLSSPDALEVTPLAIFPVYLTLIAVVQRHCLEINDKQADLEKACRNLLDSVKHLSTFLDAYKDIVPTTRDLNAIGHSGSEILPWESRSYLNDTRDARGLFKMFSSVASGSDNLEQDKIHGLYFSPERVSEIKKAILDNEIKPFNLARIAELNMNTLIQSRLSRVEIGDLKSYAIALAAVTIAPCWFLLLCVLAQFLSVKRQQMKAKKQQQQQMRDRLLLDRLLARRDENQPIAI